MDDATVKQIESDPNFKKLVHDRTSFGWTMSIIMLVIYYGFIALVAFAPSVIAVKIAGSITIGIILGLAIILAAILLTGIYVITMSLTGGFMSQFDYAVLLLCVGSLFLAVVS